MSKRSFNNSKTLNEPIIYTFSEDKITVKGESFESENSWDKYVKVLETKGLFIFYQDKLVANLIPKASFKNEDQVKELRKLIALKPTIKQNLQKD